MKRDVILAGVGGQGLLALAAVIGEAVRASGLHLKQAEVHGMAQRGGGVLSHVRYAEHPIYSDLIREGTADLILALEPMEALRYLPFLSSDGVVVSNSVAFPNVPDYPDVEAICAEIRDLERHRLINAAELAERAGARRCANMVMLGAGAPFLGLARSTVIDAIRSVFADKAASVIETNVCGFHLGLDASEQAESGPPI